MITDIDPTDVANEFEVMQMITKIITESDYPADDLITLLETCNSWMQSDAEQEARQEMIEAIIELV